MRLYNASAMAIKAVDQKLMVGGPATAMLGNVANFARICQNSKIPFDFVSTHHYPNDAICPSHERWNPDCFADNVRKARVNVAELASDAEFYMTEYSNSYMVSRGTEHDSSEAAAFAMRQVGALSQQVDMLSWWTFSDIFEESSLPTREFQNWYGLMSFNGVRKPAWRSFQLLNTHAGNYLVPANLSAPSWNERSSSSSSSSSSSNSKPMVSAFVTANTSSGGSGDVSNLTGAGIRVFLSYWWQPTGVGKSASETHASRGTLPPSPPNVTVIVSLGAGVVVAAVPATSTVGLATAHVINAEFGNPRAAWEQMGSPGTADITAAQLVRLHDASEVHTEEIPITTVWHTHKGAGDGAGRLSTGGRSVERTINVELSPNSVVVLEVV
jgi:hypothetical protein